MPRYVDAREQVACPNPECLVTRPWNPVDTLTCPVCGATGVYRGVAVKEMDLTEDEERARTVQPITEYEHAPPDD